MYALILSINAALDITCFLTQPPYKNEHGKSLSGIQVHFTAGW